MNPYIDYLDRLLVCRVRAVEAETKTFEPRYQLREVVTRCPRVVMIRSGTVQYHIEGVQWTLRPHDVVLLPGFFQRWWLAGEAPLTLSWFQFNTEPALEELPEVVLWRSAAPDADAAAIERIVGLFRAAPTSYSLLADAEIKAVLARLLTSASADTSRVATARPTHTAELAVSEAARWIARHYEVEDPITHAIEQSRLSPNHFRLVFRQRMGMSPRQYLLQVRMRAARFILHETQESVKEVAARIGYANQFHFSRSYSKFWGHAPTEDRQHAK